MTALLGALAALRITLTAFAATLPAPQAIIAHSGSPSGTIQATVTAYSSSPDETDDTPFITASGTSTRIGVAACPRWLAFGTEIAIGGNPYTCLDRMNQKYGERFDIWFPSKQDALEFGIRREEVTIRSL